MKKIFKELIQVSVNNYAKIYSIENLDDIYEVQFQENVQEFTQNPDRFVETGFTL